MSDHGHAFVRNVGIDQSEIVNGVIGSVVTYRKRHFEGVCRSRGWARSDKDTNYSSYHTAVLSNTDQRTKLTLLVFVVIQH